MTTKVDLRKKAKDTLRVLRPEELKQRSQQLEAQLLQYLFHLDHQKPLDVVGLFLALRGEPQWEERRWREVPWRLAFPAQEGAEMKYLVPRGPLPAKGPWLGAGDPCEPDLIVVPGLLFSPAGYRLGRGGGFYDRLLGKSRPVRGAIGVCFEEQLCEGIPTEAHDMKLNVIVTDRRVILCDG